jgi:hypothetical protein
VAEEKETVPGTQRKGNKQPPLKLEKTRKTEKNNCVP